MNEPQIMCSECDNLMELGYIEDRRADTSETLHWSPGTPEKSWAGGIRSAKKSEQIPVRTFRCTSCGFLKSFANGQ